MRLDRYFSHKERKGRKVFVLSVLFVASFIFVGCIYKGAKVTEGTDLAIGLTIPQTDGAAQLDVLNYLSGFRLGVAENSALTVKYTCSETNSYFGCITTSTLKTIDATVEPCESTDPSYLPARASAQSEHPAPNAAEIPKDSHATGTAGSLSPETSN